MLSYPKPVLAALVFVACCVLVLLWILKQNRQKPIVRPKLDLLITKTFGALDILSWDYEYARTTASEAMQDRHTMVNFYLLAVGLAISAVLALFSREATLPTADGTGKPLPLVTGTLLLWLLNGVGWIYFLSVIRLRQAWCESADAMSRIKAFAIQHNKDFDPDVLAKAFLWQAHTRPPAGKPWTVFFYSAMLIAFLNSVAFLGGSALLAMDTTLVGDVPFWPTFLALLLPIAIVYFLFHLHMYSEFLQESKPDESRQAP